MMNSMNQNVAELANTGSYHLHEEGGTGLIVLEFSAGRPLTDYREALELAGHIAQQRYGYVMMLSWYDRDRDFESPQHASECHLDSAVPGYVDYGLNHGAGLKMIFEGGRFVFYFSLLENQVLD